VDWFLGIIAVATLATAIVQIGAILYAGTLLRRMARLIDRVEQDLRPQLNSISREAARVATLVADRVESADRVVEQVSNGVDRAVRLVQKAASAPAREGAAAIQGLKAAVSAYREMRENSDAARAPRGSDEEDLFIG